MIFHPGLSYSKAGSLPQRQEQKTKSRVQAIQQQAANKINGVRKEKKENHSRNFQAVLVTTGVAILQLAGT